MEQTGHRPEVDRRSEYRKRALKGATIVIGVDQSEIPCMIRNINTGGAELSVTAGQALPDEFMLYVTLDRECYACRVCWRRNDRVGVNFKGLAPKPKWHYA